VNQHTAIAKTPRKTAKPAKPAAVRPPLQKVAQTVKRAGAAVARTSAKAAQPLVQSLKQEEPSTLAKMAMAALAPKIANAALRFVIRNPLITAAGLVAFAAFATMDDDGKATA
jgi:uroporphyrinogen-III synthase